MNTGATEIEVKFYVQRLSEMPQRVLDLGGQVLSARVFESNLRFDTQDGLLSEAGRALRLRRDSAVTLTYKGRSDIQDGIRSRPEIEVAVDDLTRTRALLEALGYIVTFTYEKFRAVYELGDGRIMLDELPYGDFVEIEGESAVLRPIAARLGLRWDAAVRESYLGLFENVRSALALPFNDLTFENFKGRGIQPGDLAVKAADA